LLQTIGWGDYNNGGANGTFDPLLNKKLNSFDKNPAFRCRDNYIGDESQDASASKTIEIHRFLPLFFEKTAGIGEFLFVKSADFSYLYLRKLLKTLPKLLNACKFQKRFPKLVKCRKTF
jgi:hypothetical protein